jgi:hypothetical protein
LSTSEQFVTAPWKRPLLVTGLDRASTQPCLTNDAGDFFSDQPLNHPGKVFVEPSLKQRAQHIAHDVFESAIDTSERELALPAPLSR